MVLVWVLSMVHRSKGNLLLTVFERLDLKKKREPFLIRNISLTFHNQPLRHFSPTSLSPHYRLFNISIEPLPPTSRLIQCKQSPPPPPPPPTHNNAQSMQSTLLPAPVRLMCRKNFSPVRRRFLWMQRAGRGEGAIVTPAIKCAPFVSVSLFLTVRFGKKRK